MQDSLAGSSDADGFQLDLTRPTAPVTGQLEYDSTYTAPVEWVPRVHASEEEAIVAPRGFSIAAFVCGVLGIVLGILGVFGGPFAFVAVVLALLAASREPLARPNWPLGLITGIVGLIFTGIWISAIAAGMSALE